MAQRCGLFGPKLNLRPVRGLKGIFLGRPAGLVCLSQPGQGPSSPTWLWGALSLGESISRGLSRGVSQAVCWLPLVCMKPFVHGLEERFAFHQTVTKRCPGRGRGPWWPGAPTPLPPASTGRSWVSQILRWSDL